MQDKQKETACQITESETLQMLKAEKETSDKPLKDSNVNVLKRIIGKMERLMSENDKVSSLEEEKRNKLEKERDIFKGYLNESAQRFEMKLKSYMDHELPNSKHKFLNNCEFSELQSKVSEHQSPSGEKSPSHLSLDLNQPANGFDLDDSGYWSPQNRDLDELDQLFQEMHQQRPKKDTIPISLQKQRVINELEGQTESNPSPIDRKEETFDELNRLKMEMKQLDRLKELNKRQQQLLQSRTQTNMHHEISQLSAENVHLRKNLDEICQVVRCLEQQNGILLKYLHNAGIKVDVSGELQIHSAGDRKFSPIMKKFQGMFEYHREYEHRLIRNLIIELTPSAASQLLTPILPAYIIFMCIRYCDAVNEEATAQSLVRAVIKAIKEVVKKEPTNIEVTALWLSNMLRLLHLIKQYSRGSSCQWFRAENSAKQNDQCIKNIDLESCRCHLRSLCDFIYQTVTRNSQETMQPLLVGAILENENETLVGLKLEISRQFSNERIIDSKRRNKNQNLLEQLIGALTHFHRTLSLFGVDDQVVVQIFRQAFYYIGSSSFNNLLQRKDLCNLAKSMQIRYNLSQLEKWSDEHVPSDSHGAIKKALQPMIQACQVLQAPKTVQDIGSITEMYAHMTMQRIVRLLSLYTPIDEYEDAVSAAFLKKLERKFSAERKSIHSTHKNNQLMIDSKIVFPVNFPFVHSRICLEEVEIPNWLNHSIMLKRI